MKENIYKNHFKKALDLRIEKITKNKKMLRRLAFSQLSCTRKMATLIANYSFKNALENIHSNTPQNFSKKEIKEKCLKRASRTIKRAVLQRSLYLAFKGQKVGSKSTQSKYIDKNTLRLIKERDDSNSRFLSSMIATHGTTSIPLSNLISNAYNRFCETYTIIKYLEERAEREGKVFLFLTLTAPSEYHSSPSIGKNHWNGASALDAHKSIMHHYRNAQKRLCNYGIKFSNTKNINNHVYGLRVVEPHKDGCPHHHVLLFVHPSRLDKVKNTFRKVFNFSERAIDITEQDSSLKNTAKASSYCTKYIMKSYGVINGALMTKNEEGTLEKTTEESAIEAIDAWRKAVGIRAFSFIGIKSKRQKYRAARKLKLIAAIENQLPPTITMSTREEFRTMTPKMSSLITSLFEGKNLFQKFMKYERHIKYIKVKTEIGVREIIKTPKASYLCNFLYVVTQDSSTIKGCYLEDTDIDEESIFDRAMI